MVSRRFRVSLLGEHEGKPLMSLGEIRCTFESRLEMVSGRYQLATCSEQVGQVHTSDRLVSMMKNGLLIGRAGS
ncbi:hypothetical protein [Methylobacterium sp. J-030]|uniref:hypothetical protein n=1 Tax=Methylobacterium sp. J-030 TaxID=2836627 RepID=UPI00391A4BC3